MIDTICQFLIMAILALFAVGLMGFCVWIFFTIVRDLSDYKRHQNGGRKD